MRPANIIYGVDDVPPKPVLLFSAAQHTAAVAAISFATVITVLDAANADLETSRNALRLAMLALGVSTLLHCLRWRGIGSGFLIPSVFATSYLPGMILAGQRGGMELIFGMTMIAGLVQVGMAFAVPRLRPFFPTEITGFVVFMIGLGMGIIGLKHISVPGGAGQTVTSLEEVMLGVVSLATMVGLGVWGKGNWRTFSVLMGIIVGYLLAWEEGRLALHALSESHSDSFFGLPQVVAVLPHFSLQPDLLLPFVVGALACSLRSVGDVTTSQKLNDTRWTRPEMGSIEGCIIASGLGTFLSGLLGSIGCNTASSSVGLAGATGVTSRVVGYVVAALFVLLSFLPGLAGLLAIMPRPVLGAVMLFTGSLVIMSGLQMILSRVMDMRKTVVVGFAMILGIGHDIFPQLFTQVPTWAQPFVDSSVVLSIVTALALNTLFRFGVTRSATRLFTPGPTASEEVYRFIQAMGGSWAARQDVIQRVVRAASEFADTAAELVDEGTDAVVSLAYDEFRIHLEISWAGRALPAAGALPTEEEMLEDDTALLRLASILIARAADRISQRNEGGRHRLLLDFDH